MHFKLFLCLCIIWMLAFKETHSFAKPRCRGVSDSDIKIIVNRHNYWRQQLIDGKIPNQPRATNMKMIEWDHRLAVEAQKIADKQEFKHIQVLDNRFKVGQNLYLNMNSMVIHPNWNQAVDNWAIEHKMYKYPDKPTKHTGHYTQVVWAKSTKVGCGLMCFKDRVKPIFHDLLFVCNYGPAGNIEGQAPYDTHATKKGKKIFNKPQFVKKMF